MRSRSPGNVFNVSAQGAGGASANLANFKSTQLAGQVLNVVGQSLTTGKAIAVTLGTGGTGIYLNTAAGYSGSLVSLNVNASPKLTIDQAGNTTIGGTLTIQGASITGPAAGAFSIDNGNAAAINIGGTTATTLNLGRLGQTQALLGNGTVAGTFAVTGATTLSSTLAVTGATTFTGNTTHGGTITGPAGAAFAIDSGGVNVNALTIGGANATTLNLGRTGQIQALLGNGTVAGTLAVTGATTLSSTLSVTGATTFTGNTTHGGTITGPAAAAFSIDSGGVNVNALNIGGANATTLNLGRLGQTQALLGNATVAGTLAVTGATTPPAPLSVTGATTFTGNTTHGGTITGPAAAAFSIDSGGLNNIDIGGANAATLNLGRLGQTQALLGNGTVAGTLTVTGQTTTTGLLIGIGASIQNHFSGRATLDFLSIAVGACSTLTVPAGGTSTTGLTTYAAPAPVAGGIETRRMFWQAFIATSSADVSVRVCNESAAAIDLPAQVWNVDVWDHP